MQSQEPVIVHDILSNDTKDIKDHHSLQIKAMIHGKKDDEVLLEDTCELCLEDNAQEEGSGAMLQEYTEETTAHGTQPSNEVETSGATEKPTDQEKGIKDLEGQKNPNEPPE